MGPTPQDELLVDACRRLVDDGADWPALAEAGFGALGVDAELGGGGATVHEVVLVTEQLARGPLPVPFVGTVLAADLLARADGAAAAEVLATIVAGRPAAIVVDADLGRIAGEGIAVDVRVAGQRDTAADDAVAIGWRSGEVVVAPLGEALDSVDLTRGLASVAPGAEAVGRLDPARLVRWESFARTVVSADLVGTMHAALLAAVAHAGDREQFGRPVGSFQAVQHLCADQLVSVEAARSITLTAADALDRIVGEVGGASGVIELSRVAKAYCSEAGRDVAEAALQVWGGLGMTWECPAHLWLRRTLLSRRVFGDESAQFRALADQHLFAAGAP